MAGSNVACQDATQVGFTFFASHFLSSSDKKTHIMSKSHNAWHKGSQKMENWKNSEKMNHETVHPNIGVSKIVGVPPKNSGKFPK